MAPLRSQWLGFILGCLAACRAEKDWPCDHVKQPIDTRPPPILPRRFHALIETVFSRPTSTQFAAYSLDYDQEGNKAALANVGSSGTPERARRIIDYSLNQTFLIETGKELRCEVIRPAEDDAYHVFKNFPGIFQPISPGQIFQPEQFFGMVETDKFGYIGQRSFHNSVICDVWAYCISSPDNNNDITKNVFVYWSAEGWHTTGSRRQPVGVIWRQKKPPPDEADEMIMTVADFQPEYVNVTAFEVPKGDVCIGVNSKPFPKLQTEVFRFKTEIYLPNQNLLMFSDNWIDMFYAYARKTMEMPSSPDSNGVTVNTVDYKRKVVFVQNNKAFEGCEVQSMETEVPVIESISNLHLISEGNVSLFLQPPGVDWIYVGQQRHRSITTDVWHAKRTDWPVIQTVTSSWEWHMANVSEQKILGGVQQVPVHLSITILEAGSNQMLPKGSTLLFHLYDFKMEASGTNDLYDFDVSGCYRETWKQHIQFRVTITGQGLNSKDLLERHVRDPNFRLRWQDYIALYALDRNMLRISQLESFVNKDQEVIIQFWLLGTHPDIPAELTSNDLLTARETIRDMIDQQTISFDEQMGTPIVGSLQDVAVDCPPKPVETTTPIGLRSSASSPSESPITTTPSGSPSSTSPSHGSALPSTASVKDDTFPSGVAAAFSLGALVVGLASGAGLTLLMVVKNNRCCIWLRRRPW